MHYLRILLFLPFGYVLAVSPVPEGFPATWKGDRYFQAPCDVLKSPPEWLQGRFFCQLSASYGDRSNGEGEKVNHMFDALGAVAVFNLEPNKTTYTGAYYPTRAYKIWNFYDRDFKKSALAWRMAYAKSNVSAIKAWEHIFPEEKDITPPNVDFWKIKNTIVAQTESYNGGMTFDIDTVDNFHLYPFKEASPILSGQPLIPIQVPTHERVDPETNLIWSTVLALNITVSPPSMHQAVFSIDEDGVRRVEGIYDFPAWKPRQCSEDGIYRMDTDDFVPSYMHSITSTKNYVILPFTSVLFNPCSLMKGPRSMDVTFESLFIFDPKTPLSFLIFDKKHKTFLPLIKYDKPQFVTHQFNAYESSDDTLIIDMITYDSYAYDALYVETLLKDSLSAAQALRFSVNVKKSTVESRSLLPEHKNNIEFSQFNHHYEEKPYQYGYVVTSAYTKGNSILKIHLTDPSGKGNKAFEPGENVALLEPYFVQKPDARDEDDGVIVARGLDTSIGKTRVYVLDAKTLQLIGEIVSPTQIPFGFHERFYLKSEFEDKKTKQTRTEL